MTLGLKETTEAASTLTFDLPPALATPPGAGAVCDDQGARKIGRAAAEGLFTGGDVIVFVDLNGDGSADQAVILVGGGTVSSASFL